MNITNYLLEETQYEGLKVLEQFELVAIIRYFFPSVRTEPEGSMLFMMLHCLHDMRFNIPHQTNNQK